MAELRTRKPTGKVAFPLLQLDGEEKAGKSFALATLTASPRVGRSFLVDLGDGSLDEYASLGDFDLIETNGTFTDVLDQVQAACAIPSDPEKPNVVGVDAGTLLWGLLKAKAERRAKGSKRARDILKEDPDAEIDVGMTYWNEVKDDWARLLHVLKKFPGIGVISAQGRYVSKVDTEGRPVRGQREWSTDVEKTTPQWASAMVRLTRDPREARLVGVRSLHVDIPSGGLVLPKENTLEHLIFEILGAGGFGPSTATAPTLGVPSGVAKARVLDAVKRTFGHLTEPEAKAEAGRLWKEAGLEGQREVTEVDLRRAFPDATQEPEKPSEDEGGDPPPVDPEPRQGPSGAGVAKPEGGEPDAEDSERAQEILQEKMGAQPVASTPHVLPDGEVLVLNGGPVTAAEALDYLAGLTKVPLVTLASQVGVPTAGKSEVIRERLVEAWALNADAPFAPAAPKAEEPVVDPEDELEPDPRDESGMEEVEDLPEGWVEGLCLCGEALMYEPGNVTKTIRHLNPEHDTHPAEEPF